MRAVIQRVSRASVTVAGEVVGRIEKGLLVLLGVAEGDTQDDVISLATKIAGLRIFEDDQGKMNRSILEVGGRMLVVSSRCWATAAKVAGRASSRQPGPSVPSSCIAVSSRKYEGRGSTSRLADSRSTWPSSSSTTAP
jgi:D-tyrosyl-tRNA(Tyr) deacylase